jgi:hypothetical protein
MKEPVYFIKLTNHYCNFTFKLNDIVLYVESENGSGSKLFPINQYLNENTNAIQIHMQPMNGQTHLHERTLMELSLEVASAQSIQTKQVIFESESPNYSNYSFEEKPLPESYLWTIPLKVKSPFSTYNLYKLTSLKMDNSLFNKLLDAYNETYSLFKSGNISALTKHFENRRHDIALSRYQTIDTVVSETINDLEHTFSGGNELLEFNMKDFTLRSEYGSKLYSLIDKYGDPVVIYYNEAINITTKYPMRFGILNGTSQFTIIR